jgi:hypothetical protein
VESEADGSHLRRTNVETQRVIQRVAQGCRSTQCHYHRQSHVRHGNSKACLDITRLHCGPTRRSRPCHRSTRITVPDIAPCSAIGDDIRIAGHDPGDWTVEVGSPFDPSEAIAAGAWIAEPLRRAGIVTEPLDVIAFY